MISENFRKFIEHNQCWIYWNGFIEIDKDKEIEEFFVYLEEATRDKECFSCMFTMAKASEIFIGSKEEADKLISNVYSSPRRSIDDFALAYSLVDDKEVAI